MSLRKHNRTLVLHSGTLAGSQGLRTKTELNQSLIIPRRRTHQGTPVLVVEMLCPSPTLASHLWVGWWMKGPRSQDTWVTCGWLGVQRQLQNICFPSRVMGFRHRLSSCFLWLDMSRNSSTKCKMIENSRNHSGTNVALQWVRGGSPLSCYRDHKTVFTLKKLEPRLSNRIFPNTVIYWLYGMLSNVIQPGNW